MACFSWAFVLFQHRNKRTPLLLYPSVSLGMNFEQYWQPAESDVLHSQLKCSIGKSRGSGKHHILTIGLLQLLWYNGLELVIVALVFVVRRLKPWNQTISLRDKSAEYMDASQPP
jgi:hypothetical protein